MKNILLLDDNPAFSTPFAQGLREAGYQVYVAQNGTRALNACREHQIDLVITDVFMPERDGLEVIREVRKAFPQVKIIAMSGKQIEGKWDGLYIARIMGAHSILAKPFTLSEACATIQKLRAGTEARNALTHRGSPASARDVDRLQSSSAGNQSGVELLEAGRGTA